MFFSEEKNQKTFVSPLFARSGPWPALSAAPKHKSLLVLFFRKERLPLQPSSSTRRSAAPWQGRGPA
jgi:hypothetical protein